MIQEVLASALMIRSNILGDLPVHAGSQDERKARRYAVFSTAVVV